MKPLQIIIPIAGLFFGTALLSGAPSLQIPASATTEDEITETDSIIVSPAQIMADSASNAYKKVKFMAEEGEIESVLYDAVFAANRLAMEALEMADTKELEQQCCNVLIDLNPQMLSGAVYYSQSGNNDRAPEFARGYIDVQQLPQLSHIQFRRDMQVYPSLLYNAAYGAMKEGNTEAAKKYFELYLKTPDKRLRENILVHYGQACLTTGDFARAIDVLTEGVSLYPSNQQLLGIAMQCCIDGGYPDRLQALVDRALTLNPDDERLLNIQARLYSTNNNYQQALEIYNKIAESHPNSLENTRRIANCQYNLGAFFYNQSIMEEDDKAASRARRQSKAYFSAAAQTLERVIATTPNDAKYLRALVSAYAALGQREDYERINTRLQALGEKGVAFNDMPIMLESETFKTNTEAASASKIPSYEEFARPFIEERLGTWAQRGEFETMDAYKTRIKEGEGVSQYEALNKMAQDEYLKRYARQLVINDLECSQYDIDNETYAISTPYGEAILKVPFKNKEAESFKAGWASAQIRKPRFIIRDDKVALASITFIVNGRNYTYDAKDAATYQTPNVYVDINGILAKVSSQEGGAGSGAANKPNQVIFADSDVDVNIPVTSKKAQNLYAVIIANEHYEHASDVYSALHDGNTMQQYCIKTLGVPEHQTFLLNNATGNQIRDVLEQLKRRVKGTGPSSEVIFYYAGHGMPDDATKEAYMLPVDGNPLTVSTLIPMRQIYKELGNMDAASVSVFIDACFSGNTRDEASLKKDARAVVMKAKEVAPEAS